MKPLFIDGGVKHSKIDRKQMEELWQQLQDFADYGFNKSHAACYGMIAYWTAYLKAHYPEAFMAALMTSDFNDVDRLAIEIDECRHMGIEVLAPDINQSFIEFAIVPDKHQVRFGMAAIKNVGVGAVEEIERERNANGEFKSIEDFAKRVNPRVVNRKTWESLIKAGAFDKFADRRQLLFNLDTILAYANKTSKEASSEQINLFAGSGIEAAEDSLDLAVTENVNERDVLQWERELLGIYLSRHPLDAVKGYLSKNTFHIEDISKKQSGKPLLVGGLIKIKREITTKNGKHMAFVTLEDATGEIEVIVFPDLYEKSKELWAQDLIVGVKGKVNNKDRQGRYGDEVKIIADEVDEINEDTMKQDLAGNDEMPDPSKDKEDDVVAQLFVHIKQPEDNDKLLQLKRLLNKYPGSAEAILVLGDKDKSALKLPFGVEITPELRQAISSIYSSDCVYIKS